MKRSEMLSKIRNALLGKEINNASFEQQILDTVESLGMLPPDDEGVFGWNEGWIEPPKWEAEENVEN